MGSFKTNASTPPSHPHSDRPVSSSRKHQAASPETIQPVTSTPAQRQTSARLPKTANSNSPLTKLIQQFKASLGGLRSDRLLTTASQYFLGNSQPRVKWWRDAQGHDHYSIYDPHSQRTHAFETAQEVRVWLEKRYYQ